MPSYRPQTLGIIGLICGIAGFFIGFGIILGPAALVLGWLALRRHDGGTRPFLPITALILGAVDTAIALLWLTNANWTA
jgi:hypothetical protein